METMKTGNRKKVLFVCSAIFLFMAFLIGRLAFLMIFQSEYYFERANAIHEREREIKAPRGQIYDRNGTLIAGNRAVCSISVIYSQVTDPERVIKELSERLEISEETVRKKVEKNSIREKIKSNVAKEIADEIRNLNLDGVMIDEDYKRYYLYDSLASRVIGFTGGDNQGIVGLEVFYEKYLAGIPGSINTLTNAKGIEIKNAAETRTEPVAGQNLYISLDVNIQKYCEQAAEKVKISKSANRVSMIVMNPQNGEIYAMVNVPEYNLNDPYTLNTDTDISGMSEEAVNELLNQMWRNPCISDTYEPGSTIKIVTATAALEENVVSVDDTFSCPGFKIVEDRRIKCHKTTGHGAETFKQGIMNSCNPVFMEVGARVGPERMYANYRKLGLFQKTGVDIPGEANSIMHKLENIGAVELATMSFGQSIQITPLQLLRAASAVINGGTLVTPHFGMYTTDSEGKKLTTFTYDTEKNVIREDTSALMRELLEAVVSEGSGKNAKIEGYRIGGKTATSEKLPRSENKYISSFIGFVPADNPQLIALIMIDEPQGVYYGGTIAAPVVRDVYENIMNYMGIMPAYEVDEDTTEE